VVSSTPRPHFTPGKDPVPILQEAGWATGPVWRGGKSRPHRNSIPDCPLRSWSLYRLSYPAHNHCCRGKAISITYCEFVFVVLGIRYEMRMTRIIICSLPRFTITFLTFSHKRQDFRKKIIEHKMCVLIFSTMFV